MATTTATNLAALLPGATKGFTTNNLHSSSVYALPVQAIMATRGRVRCSLEEKTPACSAMSSNTSMVASLMAVAAAMNTAAGPAMALVDERMSTEGTGLPFGLSNNILGWILLVVFGLIWSLYFIYTTDLDEDDDSGLSL